MDAMLVIALVIAAMVIILVIKGLMIVQQSEAVVIERLGSYHKTLEPGINWIIPFVDQPRSIKMRRYQVINNEQVAVVVEETRIDRRETVLDFPGQAVITGDNVSVMVNGALYFQVIDPERAVYQAENLVQAIEILAKTSLRSEVGKMELDKLFESRQEINDKLQIVMDDAGNKWGVKVTRVEIQDIDIPRDVEDAMRKQMTAERERRAMVLQASGEREAAIARAQGEKESAILVAEGDKTASILRAEGEREAINQIMAAADGRIDPELVIGYLMGLEYLNTLPNIAKEGDRVFLPFESSSVLGAVGSLQQLLQQTQGKAG
ncbi:MAG: SPFH domain-containing protein [Nitrincola lacisaponensis]|uniref:Putative stomatin/prohibitin-family membrane protease subunit YbbK n=1 Tax=Nitrincola lacisaponensis TaxID=267850 RepID=A0A063YA78_9GAMM|nr:SPFH domain-containing protein [Nitrincola lacisaponensis]KDE41232.1 putative stomatin/prohibitin-family membrane protease subunit YbbK [Nitrincola lacisaponensis]